MFEREELSPLPSLIHVPDDLFYRRGIGRSIHSSVQNGILALPNAYAAKEMRRGVAVVTVEDVFALPAPGREMSHVGVVRRAPLVAPFWHAGIQKIV